MQKTENNQATGNNRRHVQASTTLNRKYLKRPASSQSDIKVSMKKSAKVSHFYTPQMTKQMNEAKAQEQFTPHPLQQTANTKMQRRKITVNSSEPKMLTAKELKDQAIKKALLTAEATSNEEQTKAKKSHKLHFGAGRILLALGCTAVAVFAVVYFVNLNMPDISLRVAAMQTGINPSYPKYVPRDFSVSSITSEEEKITLEFRNSTTDQSFTLVEEKSAWDTNALLSNYVKKEYDENYSIVREQGLTIYISGSDAAWVNGGIVYKITASNGVLTNKQIRSIAVSL